MLSAAARPRWIAALMPDRPFSRSSSVSSATTYDMKSAKSNFVLPSFCCSAIHTIEPTAHAAKNTVSGELAAVADDSLVIALRRRLAAATARLRSYSSPPNTRTTRCPPIISSSTCVSEPERSWMSRAMRRRRRLK